MKRLLPLALTIAILSVSPAGQTSGAADRTEGACRPGMLEQMTKEAKTFGLDLKRDSLTVSSTADTLVAVGSVAGSEKAGRADLERGVDVGFVRVESKVRRPVPNGSYRIRVFASRGTAPGNKRFTASLINREGRVVKLLDAAPVEAPSIIMGTNCWVGGTYGVCFPAGTSTFQIQLWIAFMEYYAA